jgi:hypothetical protein
MHPARHRALRELHLGARHLVAHWTPLADRLGPPAAAPLQAGVADARALLDDLESLSAARGLSGLPGAQGAGATAATVRNQFVDRLLERNQAMRAAVLDVQHVVTLLAYLVRLSLHDGDEDAAATLRTWETRMSDRQRDVRDSAIATAQDPDAAIERADPSPAGRAAHALAYGLGSLGEAIDRTAARRRGD